MKRKILISLVLTAIVNINMCSCSNKKDANSNTIIRDSEKKNSIYKENNNTEKSTYGIYDTTDEIIDNESPENYTYNQYDDSSNQKVDENDSYLPNQGFNSPDEVLDNYFDAFLEMNPEKVCSLFNVYEINIIDMYYDLGVQEHLVIDAIRNEMELLQENISQYPIESWSYSYYKFEDITEDMLLSSEDGPQYNSIGTEQAYMYDGCYLYNTNGSDEIECLSDDLLCIKINGKWYLSFYAVEYLDIG